jgi:outer membrane receptor protein involved in Fe transport
MKRKHWLSLLLLLSIPGVIFAQSGKIRGTIVDQATKEPLVGANVIIEGTTMGTATDVDGTFMIINVPVGTYTMRASYIGYRTFTITNIRVSGDLTTEVNFALSSEDVQVQTVEIVAERPLVNKNATNAVRFTTAEDIQNIPVRGVANLIALSAGVVQQQNQIYIRGGRQEQVGYLIEGVQTRDPLVGGNAVTVINDAIEEIQVQSGGYNAEYGGANAGIVITSMKTGSEKLKLSGEAITDAWGTHGNKTLGTYSYGYSEYTASVSGPVPGVEGIKFFLSGNNRFDRTLPKFWPGADLRGLVDVTASSQAPIDVVYPAGGFINNATNRWTVNGNVMAHAAPFDIKVSGTYSASTQHGFNGNAFNFRGTDLSTVFNEARMPVTETEDMSGIIRITHTLSPTTFYEVSGSVFQTAFKTMDPFLKDQWWLYGDSVANAQYGFTLKAQGEDPTAIVLFGTQFDSYGTLESGYTKFNQIGYGIQGDIVHQEGKLHEFKAGFELSKYTIRSWNLALPGYVESYAKTAQSNPALTPFDILKSLPLSNYGYDFMGNETDELGPYRPHYPLFAGAYIQDKIEYQDLVINAGLRWDYFDIDQKVPTDPMNLPFDANNLIDYSKLVFAPNRQYVSPRLGFSFSMSDRTVFHAQWGRFVQQSRLRDLYLGLIAISVNDKGGLAIQNPNGWGLRPEQTTQYELGFNQLLTDNASFDITVYYRDIIDQIQERFIPRAPGATNQTYFGYVNGDFATTKGIELKFTMRRTERIMAQAYYTYSDARSTGSNSFSSFRTLWQTPTAAPFLPQYVTPVDYNQPHRGTINVDYRWGENDGGPILERLGLNLLFTFNSGHSYTRIGPQYGNTRIPTEEINGSFTPWNYQLDFKIDKSFRVGLVDLNVYVWVINALNTKNVINVFLQTGTADDDGYLSTPSGKNDVDTYGQQFAELYKTFLANGYGFEQGLDLYQDLWGTPRQIRLGLRVEY